MQLIKPLTDAELDRLAAFLKRQSDSDKFMSIAMLEGFLTALCIGPTLVPPSEWLPFVWDPSEATAEPVFESDEEAQDILMLLTMRFWNQIAQSYQSDETPQLIFGRRPDLGDSREWTTGFLLATTNFDEDRWEELWGEDIRELVNAEDLDMYPESQDEEDLFNFLAPFILLADPGLQEEPMPEESRIGLEKILELTLSFIHQYWLERRLDDDGLDDVLFEDSFESPQAEGLTEEEFDRLDAYLAEETSGVARAMTAGMIEGYMMALAMDSDLDRPNEWLPWIWDIDKGEGIPAFESEELAADVMSLLHKVWRSTLASIEDVSNFYSAALNHSNRERVHDWANGFLFAADHFSKEQWTEIWNEDLRSPETKAAAAKHNNPELDQPFTPMAPFFMLGTEKGIRLIEDETDREYWVEAMRKMVEAIDDLWMQKIEEEMLEEDMDFPAMSSFGGASARRDDFDYEPREPYRREGPKLGRNDPCPCGSGKKYKRCCGGVVLH